MYLKMESILITFWITFGVLLGPILGPKSAPEGNQKWDHFWNHVPPALRGPQPAYSGFKREVWNGYWNWNYTLQRRGRDFDQFLGIFTLLSLKVDPIFSFLEARGTQGGPGVPRGKHGGPQGALGTPSLASPLVPLALPGCSWLQKN